MRTTVSSSFQRGCSNSAWDAASVRVRTLHPSSDRATSEWSTLLGKPAYSPRGSYSFGIAAAQCEVPETHHSSCGASPDLSCSPEQA